MAPPLPDPRPRVTSSDAGPHLEGHRCTACSYPVAFPRPACPACGDVLEPALLGPQGRVWSFTTVHIPVPGREPPYRLAYVDLDDGPRVLAHVRGPESLAAGDRVRLLNPTDDGDVCVEVLR